MITCGICKFSCPSSKFDKPMLTCECPKWKFGYRIEIEDMASDEILVEDDEGWGCVMRPDFGCIHGEK